MDFKSPEVARIDRVGLSHRAEQAHVAVERRTDPPVEAHLGRIELVRRHTRTRWWHGRWRRSGRLRTRWPVRKLAARGRAARLDELCKHRGEVDLAARCESVEPPLLLGEERLVAEAVETDPALRQDDVEEPEPCVF